MGRASDVLSCVLALALAALGAGEVKPVLQYLAAGNGGVSPVVGLAGAIRQEPPFGGATRLTILLVGADKRPGDVGRSDTLLLLFLNPQTRQLALLGVPRDLRVVIPGRGSDKINHAYAFGGVGLTRRTVAGFLGREIDYHAVILFSGFEAAVDALGGVWIDVPDVEGRGRGMNYDDDAGNLHIHLRPGRQHLDGREALGFVRYRKSNTPGLGDSDEARSGRQQQFLTAMADQHLKAAGLPGLLAAGRELGRNLETDLGPAAITDLARVLHGCDSHRIMSATVPLREGGWHGHGTYYARCDEAKLRAVLQEIEEHLDNGPNPQVTVETLNACGVQGRAAAVAEALADRGFRVIACGNADRRSLERTVIEYAPGKRRSAQRAASALGCGDVREAEKPEAGPEEGPAPDLRIYVGHDYRPVSSH